MPFVGDHCKNLTTLECKFNVKCLIDNADDFVQAFTQLDKLKCIRMLLIHRNKQKTAINLFEIINSLPEEINEIHLFAKPRWNREQNIPMSVQRFRNLRKLTSVGLCLNLQEIADITTLVHLNIGLYDTHPNLSLFDKLVSLEYIDLMTSMTKCIYVGAISTKILNTIFCTCKNLKHLDIPYGPYDVSKIPRKKWINFQNLQHLGISCDIMPDLANTIVEYCKNLKHLRITSNNKMDTALKKLTELKNLECLILYGLDELPDESINAISTNCKKLKRLEIPDCCIRRSINAELLCSPSALDELSKLQYLEHLDLNDVRNLYDSTIIAIANNCKNLKSLDIQDCTSLTETALVALTNLENLHKLNVSNLDITTDSFLIKLKGLKELHCDECKEITDAGIIKFIKNNPDLKKISVGGIYNITTDMVIAADQATKNRTNGIILHIMGCSSSIKEASKSIITSQWLVVKKI
ncbi:F-box/LRR-repeat protein 2-like [Aphidius gifuensis]|uniref:F-box/LRR-repeat protein 2-like n=1 Tax=Aphidius gifuensis TaxID=684658 RepID=UPI001CDCAA4A|nr:F-box/LRR-repeat protein 2-like [Aphidius gifuensis]